MKKNKPIVLIGLMGSGKSTTGRLIAEALGLPFSDSDSFLRSRYGGPSAEIAAREGADVLHEREAEHLIEELAGEPKVIAAAASTLDDERAREAMRAATVIWLDADDEVLTQRMRTSDHRPEFAPAALRARREPYFREVADLKYDVGVLKPEEVLAAVLRDSGLPAPGRD
ncbi:shikimate kinase [Nonomuraea harbinensis]|uniref:shikimate kinase n=1 Tax=Nonomuraea harbinensis TaxID=1286938 RepID=UPI002484C5BD|nr:shikimate kinase [Nonomuraea harbinensis]